MECVDDLTTTGVYESDCTVYEKSSEYCGYYDDEDFTASEQCCACGGGEGGTPKPTSLPTPRPTLSPVAFVDGTFIANTLSLREAVRSWLSNATAAEETYGHISTWETGGGGGHAGIVLRIIYMV